MGKMCECLGTYDYPVYTCCGTQSYVCLPCVTAQICSDQVCPNVLVGIPATVWQLACLPLYFGCDFICAPFCTCCGHANEHPCECYKHKGTIRMTGCYCCPSKDEQAEYQDVMKT